MSRFLVVIPALLAVALPARADRIAPIGSPVERALRVPVVVIGKVTTIEKDTVELFPYPGATAKIDHKIAVVKVETDLLGAAGATHLKVAFSGSRRAGIDLQEGQEGLFFLPKHHQGDYLGLSYMTPPVAANAPDFKQQVEEVKTALATVADPDKALKAEKPADRHAAAVAIVYKLRTLPELAPAGAEAVPLTADESRPILKALAEGEWKVERFERALNGYRSFALLGLTEADGWKPPAAEAGKDFAEQTRAAFVKWLDGPGKDYRIKKLVPKKAK